MLYVLITINCRSLTFLLVRKTNTVFLDVLIIALYIAVKSERRTLERINISYVKLCDSIVTKGDRAKDREFSCERV